jgi:multidrug efflux pump subunit AcrA (membrane-fusion protein)
VVIAPKSALTVTSRRDGDANLFRAMVARDSKAEERFVELGLEEGDQVEIIDGLAAGDRLIINGQHMLADGDPIQISDEPPAEQPAPTETASPAAPAAKGAPATEAAPAPTEG